MSPSATARTRRQRQGVVALGVTALVAAATGTLAPAAQAAPGDPTGAVVAIEFVVEPSTVQSASSTVVTQGVTPRLVMCAPAPSVRLVGSDGATVTTGPPATVTLTPASGATGLTGPLTAQTVDGVAVFGSCASGIGGTTTGRGFQLLASSGALSDLSASFDVLQTYGTCSGPCSVAPTQGPAKLGVASGTTAALSAARDSATAASFLSFAVGQDGWTEDEEKACDPDPGVQGTRNPFRDVVTVDLNGYDKTVDLRWDKRAVQWATNNGSSQWQVCLAAEQPFAAVGGTSVQVGAWFIGALLPCDAVAPADPCLVKLKRQGGDQVATVSIPDRPGDPRMI